MEEPSPKGRGDTEREKGDAPMADSCNHPHGGLSRRRFIESVGLGYALGGAAALGVPAIGWAAEEDSGPVDCGPPPPAKPQHQTGGESFPPLPLPATPLRRSEKKRPPTAPPLVGKMAMGAPKLVVRGGKQVTQRDWLTDPADLISLLTWTNEKLGISYRAIEADFDHFSYDPRELPALLLAGHNKFELPPPVRENLARYVMDGGLIIGDACCGWKDFADAFRREMELIFPGRPLRRMGARSRSSRPITRWGRCDTKRPTARSRSTTP